MYGTITDASSKSKNFFDLTGAGYRNKLAGVAFTVGSLSMVGFYMLAIMPAVVPNPNPI